MINRLLIRKDYDFPAIHFALAKENNHPTCFLYGIQQQPIEQRNEDIKEYIQPIRKQLRNKYVSSDTLIALSLFFDFLYKGPRFNMFTKNRHKSINSRFSQLLDKNKHIF